MKFSTNFHQNLTFQHSDLLSVINQIIIETHIPVKETTFMSVVIEPNVKKAKITEAPSQNAESVDMGKFGPEKFHVKFP